VWGGGARQGGLALGAQAYVASRGEQWLAVWPDGWEDAERWQDGR